MAIFPGNWHPDYEKNMKKLEAEGYRGAKQEELPPHLRMVCGAESYLVNDAGDLKSVSQATGEVKRVSSLPPGRNCWITPEERRRRSKGGPK